MNMFILSISMCYVGLFIGFYMGRQFEKELLIHSKKK